MKNRSAGYWGQGRRCSEIRQSVLMLLWKGCLIMLKPFARSLSFSLSLSVLSGDGAHLLIVLYTCPPYCSPPLSVRPTLRSTWGGAGRGEGGVFSPSYPCGAWVWCLMNVWIALTLLPSCLSMFAWLQRRHTAKPPPQTHVKCLFFLCFSPHGQANLPMNNVPSPMSPSTQSITLKCCI